MTIHEETLLSWRNATKTIYLRHTTRSYLRATHERGRPLYRGEVAVEDIVVSMIANEVGDIVVVGETMPGTVRFHVLPTGRSATWTYNTDAMRAQISPGAVRQNYRGLPAVVADLADWLKVDPHDVPQCVEHDDCAEVAEMGCACWESRHPERAEYGRRVRA